MNSKPTTLYSGGACMDHGMMLKHIRDAVAQESTCVPGMGSVRRAAVAMVFDRYANVLFMQRAVHDGDPWSGHVSFPGGRNEEGESLLETAIRETREEVGLDLRDRDARLVGELSEVRTVGVQPALVIRPFVFFIQDFEGLVLNREVARTMVVPFGTLLANEGRGEMELPWEEQMFTLPCVRMFETKLWGLTLQMVDDLLHRIDGGGMGLSRMGDGTLTPWEDPRRYE